MVVLPLLPAFEGDIADAKSSVLRIQLHWEYHTISRGGNSLIEILTKEVENPSDYIIFVGLRTHGVIKNKPVTEMVYVHSKVNKIYF